MRILVLGGTGFVGTPLVRHLGSLGHEIAIFHRGRGCHQAHFHGERAALEEQARDFAAFNPEAVIDLIAGSGAAARRLLRTFPGVRRLVVASSMEVYRACGIFHGTEPGPPDPRPLDERSPLRAHAGLYPASALARMGEMYGWLGEGYDKIGMERELAQGGSRVTILRLPMMYGAGDRQHRLFPLLKRMRDNRPAILLQRGWAEWRSPRGYVENAASAIALAATAPRAAGRVYNVADPGNFSEIDWAVRIAGTVGWRGRFLVTSPRNTPLHLRVHAQTAQSLVVDSSRIRNELGYREPVALAGALAAVCAWQQDNPPAVVDASNFDYAAEDHALRTLTLQPSLVAG